MHSITCFLFLAFRVLSFFVGLWAARIAVVSAFAFVFPPFVEPCQALLFHEVGRFGRFCCLPAFQALGLLAPAVHVDDFEHPCGSEGD